MLWHPGDSGSARELKEEAFIQYEQAIDSNLGGNNVSKCFLFLNTEDVLQKETLAGNS